MSDHIVLHDVLTKVAATLSEATGGTVFLSAGLARRPGPDDSPNDVDPYDGCVNESAAAIVIRKECKAHPAAVIGMSGGATHGAVRLLSAELGVPAPQVFAKRCAGSRAAQWHCIKDEVIQENSPDPSVSDSGSRTKVRQVDDGGGDQAGGAHALQGPRMVQMEQPEGRRGVWGTPRYGRGSPQQTGGIRHSGHVSRRFCAKTKVGWKVDAEDGDQAGECKGPKSWVRDEGDGRDDTPAKLKRAYDAKGREIRETFLHSFTAGSDKFEEIKADPTALQTRINESVAEGEKCAGVHIAPARVKANIVQLRDEMKHARPYLVCPTCAGKGCETCFSLGWVNKVWYEAAGEAVIRVFESKQFRKAGAA